MNIFSEKILKNRNIQLNSTNTSFDLESEVIRMKAYEKIVSKALNKAKYRHVSKCKSEILNAVKIYRGLSPQFETFTFDNGDEKQLLNLHGTIPVDYKGSTYNIPVCLWFLYEYPNTAPMGFVVPTKEMQLKVSDHKRSSYKKFNYEKEKNRNFFSLPLFLKQFLAILKKFLVFH